MDELSLSDYLSILKRRKKWFFITAAVLFALSALFSLSWSNYRASATVEVEPSEVPASVTMPIGMSASDMSQALADLRISHIQQKVLSTGSLVDIITKFNLYPGARESTPIADVADKMRKKIRLDLVSSALANPASAQKASAGQLSAIAFTLSFDYSDPLIAQQVTNEIVTRFLDEDLKDRRTQAKETSAFLAAQITALEATMAEQEKKIAEFRATHGDTRPEALLFNQQAAANIFQNLRNLESQITTVEGTQGALRAQLATVDPYSRVIADGQVLTTPRIQLKALQAQLTTLSAQYGPNHPDVIKTRNQIEALEAQVGGTGASAALKAKITDTRANLAAAQKTKGPDHPDVLSLQNQLKNLEQQLAQAKSSSDPGAIKNDADNPAYLQIVAQLHSAEEQHKSLLTQRDSLLEQQAKYQQAVAANPAVEQQLAFLSRDYDNSQLRYRELKEKKMAADMGEKMEQERKGQRLIVINPPELPLDTQPSRLLILLAGFMFSLMGGAAGLAAAQLFSQSVIGARHLGALAGAPPLVTIPHITTKEERRFLGRRRRRAVSIIVVLSIVAIAVFHYAVMPLDVLWSVLFQRFGMS